jgi:hypothetical protein
MAVNALTRLANQEGYLVSLSVHREDREIQREGADCSRLKEMDNQKQKA